MALGAIEAIEGAGLKPGKDIKIVSIDAVKDGMQALADGKINFLVECNPLLGPQLLDLVKKVKAGRAGPGPRRDPSTVYQEVNLCTKRLRGREHLPQP